MSFFSRIKNIFVQNIVEDEFRQPLTEHQIYSSINKTSDNIKSDNTKSNLLPESAKQVNVFDIANSIPSNSLQLQLRLLGYDPSVQTISSKVNILKTKLQSIDAYLLMHYQRYLQKITQSLEFYSQGKEFYSPRKKAAELRFIIQKMNKILCKGKIITKLNIRIKNIKNTIKLLDKVPNIKKMNLMELKSIDLQKLSKTNDEIAIVYKSKLICLQNLSKYIIKVNNQSFAYIINNLKMCFDSFDSHVYQQIIRSYLITQPQTILEKLMISLLQEKIRHFFDNSDGLVSLGKYIIDLMINLHKIIKWHMINRAIQKRQKKSEIQTLSSNQSESDKSEPRRRLSVTSDYSEQGTIQIQLNQIVYIKVLSIKEVFNKIIDNCLTDLTSDNIISSQIEHKQMFNQLQILAKIHEICHNFTGLHFEKLRKLLIEYFNRRQNQLFTKCSKQVLNSIQQQKNDWNRVPYSNNFKFTTIDKILYRWTKMNEIQQYKKIYNLINKLFLQQLPLIDSSQSQQQQILQLKIIKMQSSDKLQRRFDEWNPSNYLQIYQGDTIICQSSYKMLLVFQKYSQFLVYTPNLNNIHTYYQHMLYMIEYQIFFIFNSLLSSKYRNLFYQQCTNQMQTQKKYTLKRFKNLYPKLSLFLNNFKHFLEQLDINNPLHRIFIIYKKDIKEVSQNIQENQMLRAKVIATQSTKYCLAYFHQILKTNPQIQDSHETKQLFNKVEDLRITINELSIILLTQSSQNMVGLELQSIRTLFQSIRWYQSYEQLRQYIQKIISIIRESFQKLKSSNRGEIPLSIINFISIFIWRTILTYSVKLFLDNKTNNKRENKLNFEKFIDQSYFCFEDRQNKSLSGLFIAYNIFKSIFKILFNQNEQQAKVLLIQTMKKYDYIYSILISIMQNSDFMVGLSQRQKQIRRQQFKEEVQLFFKQNK